MIAFNNEDIAFALKNKSKLKTWIAATISKTKKKPGDISFAFCSDSFLLNINKQYLNHDTYTDIITFDYCEGVLVSGDIFISIDRVKENAEKFSPIDSAQCDKQRKKKSNFEDELHRVMIHGVLHLLGYKDKSRIAKAEMTKQEDLCLKALKKA